MEKSSRDYRKDFLNCWRRFILFVIAIRTFIVRCIFILYASIAIWNVVIVKTNFFWLLLLTLVPLFIETFIGIHQIKMDEKFKPKMTKWFSPVVLLFLVCACPPIWIMELTIASNFTVEVKGVVNKSNISNLPITSSKYLVAPPRITTTELLSLRKLITSPSSIITSNENITLNELSDSPVQNNSYFRNFSLSNNKTDKFPNLNSTDSNYTIASLPAFIQDRHSFSLNNFKKAFEEKSNKVLKSFESILSHFDIPSRVTILEQVLLLVLIICRWILPRGGITRDQLSQLLLVNIGMAADILELFEAIKEDKVRHNLVLNMIILFLWQSSLFQFSLTKTVTKARKTRAGFFEELTPPKSDSMMKITNCICCQTELWAIATSLLLQDIPFFCLRMTLIVHFEVLSYSNIFFTCKNSLVIMLQLFRSYVILLETKKSPEDDEPGADSFISRQSSHVQVLPTRWNNDENQHRMLITRSQPENLNEKGILDRQPLKESLPKASPDPSIKSNPGVNKIV